MSRSSSNSSQSDATQNSVYSSDDSHQIVSKRSFNKKDSTSNTNHRDVTQGTVFSSDDNQGTESLIDEGSTVLEPAGQLTSTVQKATKEAPILSHWASPIFSQGATRRERQSKRYRGGKLQSISEESLGKPYHGQHKDKLLEAVEDTNDEPKISDVTNQWTKKFFGEENPIAAYDSFMTLFLTFGGVEKAEPPTNYSKNGMKKYAEKLEKDFWNDSQKRVPGAFPSSSDQQKKKAENFRSFVMHTIVISSKQEDQVQQLFDFLLLIIENFRMSTSLKLKHTCAVLALSTIDGILQTYFYLVHHLEKLEYLKETAEARNESNNLIANLTLRIDILHETCKIYEKTAAQLLGSIFLDFIGAKEEAIVAECLHYLSTWIVTYASIFLTPSYLLLIRRVLCYPEVSVRIKSLLCFQSIFTTKSDEEIVKHWYNVSKNIICVMIQDENVTVAQLAISVISLAYRNWDYLVPHKHIEKVYKLIYYENKLLSEAAGKFLWYAVNNIVSSNHELLISLAEFHYEAEMPKKNLQKLVDAIFPLDTEDILVDWNSMINILLDEQIQSEYNLRDEELVVLTQLMIHLIRKAVPDNPQISKLNNSHKKHYSDKVLNKMLSCQRKVTVTFIKHLPNLIGRFATNREFLKELVTIPQYYTMEGNNTIPLNVQRNLEYFLDIIDTLVITDSTSESVLIHCVTTMYILLKNTFFLHITQPKIEETLQKFQTDVEVVCENMINELNTRNQSSENTTLPPEYCIHNLEPKLVKMTHLLHFFGLSECREVAWNSVLTIISSLTLKQIDWSIPRFQKIPESAVQVCRQILIRLQMDANVDCHESDVTDKRNEFLCTLLQILGLPLPDYQNSIKFEACDAFLKVTTVFNYWDHVQPNDVNILKKFFREHIFVEPNIICEEMNTEEKYYHNRMRDLVGMLCHSINNSTSISASSLRIFIYSQQSECEQLYLFDNVVETYLKTYLQSLATSKDIKETFGDLMENKFKNCTQEQDMNIEQYDIQAENWSKCVPTKISKSDLRTFHLEGIDLASRLSHGWLYLRGLTHFSKLLRKVDATSIIKELGEKIQEQNLTLEDTKSIDVYKNSLLALQKYKGRRPKAGGRVSANSNQEEGLNISISNVPPEPDEESTLTEEHAAQDDQEVPDSSEEVSQENSQTSPETMQNESILKDHEEETNKRAKLSSTLMKRLDEKWMNTSQSSYSTRSSTRKKAAGSQTTRSSVDENSEGATPTVAESENSFNESTIVTRSLARALSFQSTSSNSSLNSNQSVQLTKKQNKQPEKKCKPLVKRQQVI